MALPQSITAQGFVTPAQSRSKVRLSNGQFLKPLLIGTDGATDTGKTRFALTVPGNIQMFSIDRNYDGVFDSEGIKGTNPNVALKVFEPPLQGQGDKNTWAAYHNNIKDAVYKGLVDPWSSVIFVDGDSDWWEVHVLAHFGKLTQIYPTTRYAAPYAEKRAIIAKMHDSGKIIICTNKVKPSYETVYKADGTPEKDSMGEDMRKKTGEMERQGFKDQDYLWNIQLRHLYQAATTRQIGPRVVDVPQQWGVQITKCKHNMGMVGAQLWGDDCNFKGLVQLVFPEIPIQRWGF